MLDARYDYFNGASHLFRTIPGGGDDIIEASDRATRIGGGGRDIMLGGAWDDLLIGEMAAYDHLLARLPNVTGLEGWGFSLAQDATPQDVLGGIMASREHRLKNDLPHFFAPTEEAVEAAHRALGPGPDVATVAAQMREIAADDTLVGRAGNDLLVDGALGDAFVFAPDAEFNRVLDFEVWDTLDLRAFGFGSAADARTAFGTQDGKAVFNADGTAIVLYGFPAETLSAEMLLG